MPQAIASLKVSVCRNQNQMQNETLFYDFDSLQAELTYVQNELLAAKFTEKEVGSGEYTNARGDIAKLVVEKR